MSVQFNSIRKKLLYIVMSTTLVALTVALVGNIIGDLWSLYRDRMADLNAQSQLLGRMSEAALSFNDRDLASENLRSLEVGGDVRAAALFDERGKLFASFHAPGPRDALPVQVQADGAHLDGGDLVVFRRIIKDGNLLGTIYLRARYDLLHTIGQDIGIGAAVWLLAMGIAFLMVARLERIVTGPLAAVAGTAREVVAQRDYSRRVANTGDDEVGAMVESFNAMLTEIERRNRELQVSYLEISRAADERARAQAATATAEAANRAKSAFLSSMSHELRTPLNAILGFAQLLACDDVDANAVLRQEFTGYILNAGTHLLTLVNEILDLARVESGTLTLSLEPVALADVMLECRAMIEPLGQQRGIRMSFPAQLDIAVLADRTRLKQVLLNLLSNAVKYNRPAGTVAVDCHLTTSDTACILVRDTGIGLSAAQCAGLFQPFNRLGQEQGAEEGTGIGLVVTRRLVELMGGSVGASSAPGVGSVFWLEFQCAPLDGGSAAATAAGVRLARPTHAVADTPALLYVEDNPANLRLVEEVVHQRLGLRLMAAPDAQLGIELAYRHGPRVILMDINLPGIGGIEALAMLRACAQTAAIPVIAISANAMPLDVASGMAAGFFRYITKPIDFDALTEAIGAALARTAGTAAPIQAMEQTP